MAPPDSVNIRMHLLNGRTEIIPQSALEIVRTLDDEVALGEFFLESLENQSAPIPISRDAKYTSTLSGKL